MGDICVVGKLLGDMNISENDELKEPFIYKVSFIVVRRDGRGYVECLFYCDNVQALEFDVGDLLCLIGDYTEIKDKIYKVLRVREFKKIV